jgi:hypothetical protein
LKSALGSLYRVETSQRKFLSSLLQREESALEVSMRIDGSMLAFEGGKENQASKEQQY